MAKNKVNHKKKDNRKLYAFISSFFTIIGFILALVLWRDDKYIMYYAKQGLILFIGSAIIGVLSPFLFFITGILWVFWVILWIVTWVNSFSGEMKRTFLISDLADKIVL